MDAPLATCLSTLTFGEMQESKNLALLPLFLEQSLGPEYLTLGEALAAGTLTIEELGSGSVPELQVKNAGDQLVLVLDGEELAGAKQNRVLNGSILLSGHSKTIIPVSCTEQGRWSFTSPVFRESGVSSPPHMRQVNKQAVIDSLAEGRGHRGNQGQMWDAVHAYARQARTSTPTQAMRDIYEHSESALQSYMEAFSCLPEQKGAFVFLNGKPAGFDLLSRASSYARLHSKLTKSYALEAMLAPKQQHSEPSVIKGQQFMEAVKLCEERRDPAVGCGEEMHYRGPLLVGSALLYEASVIHAAFFAVDEEAENEPPMVSFQRRRAYRFRREEE